jgi:hypothetical protein
MLLNLVFTSIILTNLVTIGSFICSVFMNSLSNCFNFYVFDSISDPINTKSILKTIKDNGGFISKYNLNDGKREPEGICFNHIKKYLVYIENFNTSNNYSSKINSRVYIIGKCPIEIKNNTNLGESENTSDGDETKNKVVELYLSSAFYDGQFKQINLPFNNFEPLDSQIHVINNIINSYENNIFQICRCLVWGEPRKGKSFIGKLLASKFESAYCFDIKLDSPGTQLLTLWETFKPDKNRPLIVQIDEFDILLKNIHNQNIKHEHDWLKTIVYDKQSYNTFMSEYLICLPYVIYLFTMNSTPEDIHKMDESFIRTNRVDLIIEM